MTNERILIIGAGAAGLMAARMLAQSGKHVTVLEAKELTGGRILDYSSKGNSQPFMLGAEFIHGNAELTFSLLDEAGIAFKSISGKNYNAVKGKLTEFESDRDFWPELMEKLELLQEDVSLAKFLDLYFSDKKYNAFRASVLRFVEGYDAADANKVSSLSLKKEWELDDEQQQFRIEGGYSRLIKYLEEDNIAKGVSILTGKVISHFNWSRGFVEAIAVDGSRYAGRKVIITVPLGVLQMKEGDLGSITLNPPLPIRMGAVRFMGFGSVIKVILQFKKAFWPEDAGFIFAKEAIPVWWTQAPNSEPVLTGWLAGPGTEKYKDADETALVQIALKSLSGIFSKSITELKADLLVSFSCNWVNNPFSKGAYTYITVEEPNAAVVLSNPVQGTLYFSGEATYNGPHVGTVEAALVSGKEVAERVMLG